MLKSLLPYSCLAGAWWALHKKMNAFLKILCVLVMGLITIRYSIVMFIAQSQLLHLMQTS